MSPRAISGTLYAFLKRKSERKLIGSSGMVFANSTMPSVKMPLRFSLKYVLQSAVCLT